MTSQGDSVHAQTGRKYSSSFLATNPVTAEQIKADRIAEAARIAILKGADVNEVNLPTAEDIENQFEEN